MKTPPKIISIEGIDGSGKSSVANWLKGYLESVRVEVVLLREPGSTPVGEILRNLLLDKSFSTASPWTDTLLFYAARVENIFRNINPAIQTGKWVILDRFQDATIAYQGYGQGLDVEKLERVYQIVTNGFAPDWTILMDCPVDVAMMRIPDTVRTRWERMGEAFLERVRKGYLDIASRYPDRFTVVDGAKPIEEVFSIIEKNLLKRLNQWSRNERQES